MTRSKLSASDREELIRLFKETTETITSLANQFQVSISTARRVLKTQIAADEYESIVTNRLEGRQSKRHDTPSGLAPSTAATDESSTALDSEPRETSSDPIEPNPQGQKIAPPIRRPQRRLRRRSSVEDQPIAEQESISEADMMSEPNESTSRESSEEAPDSNSSPSRKPRGRSSAPMKDSATDVDKDAVATAFSETGSPLEIRPIETVALPNQCYLVVDRASELITPALKEFSELGNIPSSEESAKTLPIFENHKIASRFSRRSQRIIKIPNSDILKKTYSLLQAKGVERILFDGQVFSLSNSQP